MMKKPFPSACSAVVLLLCGFVAAAQTTARQGEQTNFQSPMILETTFPLADRSTWNTDKKFFMPKEWVALSRYRCEGVKVLELTVSVSPLDDEQITVTFRAALSNRHGHDKRVHLMFEILNGSDVAVSRSMAPVDVPEDNTKVGLLPIPVAMKALKTDPETRLRITVRTQDY
jgi:hypothetical protein